MVQGQQQHANVYEFLREIIGKIKSDHFDSVLGVNSEQNPNNIDNYIDEAINIIQQALHT